MFNRRLLDTRLSHELAERGRSLGFFTARLMYLEAFLGITNEHRVHETRNVHPGIVRITDAQQLRRVE